VGNFKARALAQKNISIRDGIEKRQDLKDETNNVWD